MTTKNSNSILVSGDLHSTANNVADVLSLLACVDFEHAGSRSGAGMGLFLTLDTLARTLDDAADRESDNAEAKPAIVLELTEGEMAELYALAEAKASSALKVAGSMLSEALRQHAQGRGVA